MARGPASSRGAAAAKCLRLAVAGLFPTHKNSRPDGRFLSGGKADMCVLKCGKANK